MNSHYNIFVGTENGLLKGINTKSKTFNNLNNIENLAKDKEIMAMCWANDSTQDAVDLFLKLLDKHLIKYMCDLKLESSFEDLGEIDCGAGEIKSIANASQDQLVVCTDAGALKLFSIKKENDDQFRKSVLKELQAGQNISLMKMSPFNDDEERILVATGGKENDLKVWDLKSDSTDPVFKAKNLADNWIQLREPVWITCIDFIEKNKVAIGTAYHQIRIYDLKSGVRRPLLSVAYSKHPITAIASIPNDSERLIVANTFGEVQAIDIKPSTYIKSKNSPNDKRDDSLGLKKYKGFQGTIRSMRVERLHFAQGDTRTSKTCLATCGLDRFLRVHDTETGELLVKVFLKSRLNCLLFSKHEPISTSKKANENNKSKRELDDDQVSEIHSEDLGTDDLWSDMDTIVEEHPHIKNALSNKTKRKAKERLLDFDSNSENDSDNEIRNDDELDESDRAFLKPRPVKLKKMKRK